MTQQQKYAELFAAEAREHLAEMGRALVALEEEPGDQGSLDAIFRAVHTIKGMAAAMGYDVPTRLSHNIESVLDELRSGRRQVNSDVIDLLLESSDLLEAAVEATVAGKEPPEPSVIIERLVLWRLSDAAAGPPTPTPRAEAPAWPAPPLEPSTAPRPLQTAPSSRRSDTSRLRVDIRRLDALMNLMGELMILRGELTALADDLGAEPLQDAVERAGRFVSEMQAHVVEARMVPVWQIFDRFPRLVRDAARSTGKEVELEISGKELELDRSLLDAIGDPLVHLLRNAVDHGIETPEERERAGKPRVGRIELTARRERSRVAILLHDDGRGIDRGKVIERARREGLLAEGEELTDHKLFRIMARPGFTTAAEITTLSGRGVGLDVVETTIRSLGGSVAFSSKPGDGTSFRLDLPLTLAILRALIVDVGGQIYAVPATFTRESFEVEETAVERALGREWVDWHGERAPLTRLQELFAGGEGAGNSPARNGSGYLSLVGLEFGGSRLVVSVDQFLGEEEIVIKPFDPPRGAVPVFSGAIVRPDGRPALVLDVGNLS
ncbi:MAG: chemotaxis protein CheA [Gemmatimonadota bacterium]|nr:MAG: chemotaxis protein CheA [Gemmatimonadota bacterium]